MEFKEVSLEELEAMDCFSLFGIDGSCTDEELKKRYRKISGIYHPDINKDDPQTTEKQQIINVAYEKIKTEEKRRNYIMTDYARDKNTYEEYKRRVNQRNTNPSNSSPIHNADEENRSNTTSAEHTQYQNNQNTAMTTTMDEETKEEQEFQAFLNSKGAFYKATYYSYYEELQELQTEMDTIQGMDPKRVNKEIRKLAIAYTENAVNHHFNENKGKTA